MILREWIWILCVTISCLVISTVHSSYRGGTIQWRPVHLDGRVQITHRIAWRGDSVQGGSCMNSTTGEGNHLGAGELMCRVGCSGTIGPTTSVCNDFGTIDNWSAGQRTYEYDLGTNSSYFEASYTDRGFIPLLEFTLGWQLRVSGSLVQRADIGLINTPPVSDMLPVIRLQQGCSQTIKIPVEDIDGDHVRCRWTQRVRGECDDLCSVLLPATLNESSCELHHLSTSGPGAFFVALQIEDFASAADTTPLSSIPLQFVALVTSSPLSCSDRPRFTGGTRLDGSCIGVPFNTTWSEPIIAQTTSSNTSIVEITVVSPPGTTKSELLPTGNAMEWYITTIWTPTSLQYGPNFLCYMAIDSTDLATPQTCITLLGGVGAPLPVPDSMTPTGEIFPNHREWSIKFNKQFIRSPRARYIRILEESAGEVISINVKDSTAVMYPNSEGQTLKFYTNFIFSVNHTYYVLMDPGVAVDTDFCNAESPALRDNTLWVVTVKDEPSISTCSFGDIRLVGGSTAYEGRVELCSDDGEWGTVCDDGWDVNDASVTCKQAGFQLNDVTVTAIIGAESFGEGIGPILLDDIRCTGEESSLFDCAHRGLGRHNCRHTEDAGVSCKPCEGGEVRLSGGRSTTNGRVEICIDERWGTVCGDSWDLMEVEVVCRQLGYLGPGAKSVANSYFGIRSGPVNLYDLDCSGTENNFTECAYERKTSNCRLSDAGAFCTVCSDGDVRLVDGASVNEGRVEVCYNFEWTTVCDKGWDNNDASVVCGQLGFSLQGAVAKGSAVFGEGTGIVLIERVTCFGREDSIFDCYNPGIEMHSCRHPQDAGVICQFCEDGEVRLVGGGSDMTVGRVEVCMNKTWGTVCDGSWDVTDARVVCSQLGYLKTNATVVSNFSQGSGPIFVTQLECGGDEMSILECPFDLDTSDCSHSNDAGVQCYVCLNGDIRLVGGSTANEGRVELCHNNQWGTVCDDGWDDSDASVACRQAGFSLNDITALATVGASFGRGLESILLDDIGCTGAESSLFDCPNRGISIHNCGHSEDAGVICKFCEDGDVRLTGGSSATNGIVEVCIAKVWGTVCTDSWDLSDVQVACRQLGYLEPSSMVVSSHRFQQSDGVAIISGLLCTGEENTILDCAYDLTTSHCNNESAALQCIVCSDGDIRLVGGSVASEGRIELCYSNQWGAVCDIGWDNSDASVVCGQAGYSLMGAVANGRATFGQGSGPVFLERVACFGREDNLLNCSNPGVGTQSCNHHQDAGVICQFCEDGEVRLVGGGSDATVGRVEVCLNKAWGTVCDDSWDVTDAGVVCSQLGYLRTNASAISNAYYGLGSRPIFVTRLKCNGDEKSILECSHDLYASSCTHSDDAVVRCTVCLNGDIRLVDGSTVNEGRVELCHNNQWGTVCDDGWDVNDASVACRQAGFSSSDAAVGRNALFGRGTGRILLDEVACTGSESSLFSCPSRGIGNHNCGHSEDAGVICTVLVPFTLTFVNNTPRVEDNRISIDFVTSRPMSSASCFLRNDQLNLNKNCTSGRVEFSDLSSSYYIFRVEARDRELVAQRLVIRKLLEVVEIPFSLTFVNNTPYVEENQVSISFITSKQAYSAMCYLGRNLRKYCTAGHVEFIDVSPASYPFRVVALDKERFGHKIIERRTIHVLGEGSLSCAVHLVNEGATVSGRNLSVHFVGIGPVESYFCRIDRSPFLPCNSPVEYNNLEHGIHAVRVRSQKCGKNDKRLSFKITV